MKSSVLSSVTLLFGGAALAYPQLAELASRQDPPPEETNDHSWIPAANIPGAVRSPCPGTNTLANHGFINRDGKGVSAEMYMQGFLDAFGMGADGTQFGAFNALRLCGKITGQNCTTFDLDMLSTPHGIEHDASLTRIDYGMRFNHTADNHDYNETAFLNTLHAWTALDPLATHLNITMASSGLRFRQKQSAKNDFKGWYINNEGNTASENAFILSTMNDPELGQDYLTNPQARLDWINHWFKWEELPTALGWTKTTASISSPKILASSVREGPTYAVKPCPGGFGGCPAFNGNTAEPTPPIDASHDSDQNPTPGKYTPLPKKTKTKRGAPLEVRETAKPVPPPSVMSAAASAASALAGPPPRMPNAYEEKVSPEQWAAVGAQAAAYVDKVEALYKEQLDKRLPPRS